MVDKTSLQGLAIALWKRIVDTGGSDCPWPAGPQYCVGIGRGGHTAVTLPIPFAFGWRCLVTHPHLVHMSNAMDATGFHTGLYGKDRACGGYPAGSRHVPSESGFLASSRGVELGFYFQLQPTWLDGQDNKSSCGKWTSLCYYPESTSI